jgi:hypothetical protein
VELEPGCGGEAGAPAAAAGEETIDPVELAGAGLI